MSFAERQRHLLQTGEFSDFILTVDGRDFKVHRNVVCPQSTMLHRLCTGNFKEGLEGRGTLTEENADIFEKVLEFMYTGEYNSSTKKPEIRAGDGTDVFGDQEVPEIEETETASIRQQSEQLMVHTEIYLLAKYLDIRELMRQAMSRFTASVEKNFRADAFLEPFSRVFNHGGDGANGLRAQILESCLAYSGYIPQDGELTLLLLRHEPIAWKLLSRQAHEHACQAKKAIETQRALERDLRNSQEAVKILRQQVEEVTADRDHTLKLLKEHDSCRNCRQFFGSYVEEGEPRILRCKSCRCRHN
ncbi:hypothetical protein A1O3_01780 [Capronia epimyces CBS 606.96]|uniref:BTB domain-containing protein n=1 Tax=Capronia epimyces CBS 606.96 TaxID=1182542 RepID=W9YKX2_9EURO|nr:uncharacterized protein A1O3_01780 [Capronia epimyces CBS 606.96]EXJ93223.1 hypothetical protein A1O3_01780 [Capronia epimyces CBS 606.96]